MMKTRLHRAYSTVMKSKSNGTTTVIASTPTPDRYDDIVAGGDEWIIGDETSGYLANPVVQFGHDYTRPPVGRTEKLTTDKDGNLIATIKWDDVPTNPLGQTVAAQFASGMMSAVSVGFQPGRSIARNKLPTDHPHYGEKGMQFTQNHLLEISAVPVPANGEALALRGISTDQMKSILSVEETEDSYIVTYAKYPGGEAEEPEEEAFGDEEDEAPDEDEEDEDEAPDEDEGDAYDEDEEDEEEGLDEDDEDEPKKTANARRMVLRSLVRDVLFELIGNDPAIRSLVYTEPTEITTTRRSDSMSALFGIDK